MAASITDTVSKYSNGSQPLPTQLSAEKTSGATTASISAATGWDTSTVKFVRMYQTEVVNGQTVPDQSTICFYKATLSGTTLSDLTLVWSATGSDQTYPAGSTVDLSVSAGYTDALASNILTHADQDGTLKAGAVDVAGVLASNVVTYPKLESELQGGWNSTSALPAISTVVANGNRSYTLTHASSIASVVSPGMRRRFTRTSAAPITSFSLDGSNDYFNKTSPAGMTFTDDFVVSAWIKISNYQQGIIASRYNGTSGWIFQVGSSSGEISLVGYNAGAGNSSRIKTYQSVPLNKWVHVTAQLDMSAFTATTTTSYVMFDGVNVPAFVERTGTNPTALIQAGNLEIGSANSSLNFPGKIAQVAIYSAKVTQATILASIHQGLTGSETSLISAYSGANTTDLNTTNANNLTAQNSAVSGYADAPFGNGGISSTLEYGLTMSVSSDGLTEVVQCPEASALPTTGGITASAYSSMANPFGWVGDKGRWAVTALKKANETIATGTSGAYVASNHVLSVPIGAWRLTNKGTFDQNNTVAGTIQTSIILTGSVSGNLADTTSYMFLTAASANIMYNVNTFADISLTTAETYTLKAFCAAGGGTTTANIRGDISHVSIHALPSGL